MGGKLSLNNKREDFETFVDVFQELTVGTSLSVIGGGSDNTFFATNGSVGGGVKLAFAGDADCRMGFDSIGGPVTAVLGVGDENVFNTFGVAVKGPISVTSSADVSSMFLSGTSEGTSIRYTGGAGADEVDLQMVAPRATATLDVGAGDDRVNLFDDGSLVLKRFDIDFGEGTDRFFPGAYVPPAGSKIENLP